MLASGYPTIVGNWTRSFPMPTRLTSTSVLNAAGQNAWRKDGPTEGKCVWEKHGVWGYDVNKKEGVVLRENYFVKHPVTGKKVGSSLYPYTRADFCFRSTGTLTSITRLSINGTPGFNDTLTIRWCSSNRFQMKSVREV